MKKRLLYSSARTTTVIAFLCLIFMSGLNNPSRSQGTTPAFDMASAGFIPAQGSIYSGQPNVFQWNRDAEAVTQYRLKVRTAQKKLVVNAPFAPDAICDLVLCQVDIGTQVSPGVRLKQNGLYAWRLSTTINGVTTQSPWLSFTNRVLPVAFELIAPINNATSTDTRPLFTWVHHEHVTNYRVKLWSSLSDKIFNDIAFSAETICSSVDMQCSVEYVQISGKEEIDNSYFYRWQVIATNPQVGGKSKSVEGNFKINFPGKAILLNPVKNTVVTTETPTFTWENVELAEEYRFVLLGRTTLDHLLNTPWMASGSSGLVCDETICTFTPEEPLPIQSGRRYMWYIRAQNQSLSKNISKSSTEKFMVDLSGSLRGGR